MLNHQTHRRLIYGLSGFAVFGLWNASAHAVVLSNNLSTASGGTEAATGSTWLAASFATDASAYTLDSVTLSLANSVSGSAQLSLYSDGTLEPGSLIGTLTSPASYSSSLASTVFTSGSLSLTASTTYWVVLKATTGQFDWSWAAADTGSGVGFQTSWAYSDDAGTNWWGDDTYPFQLSVAASVPVAVSTWNVNANGNWTTSSNWLNGVPNATGAAASFGSAIGAARTVTLDASQTVGSISFDNANKYTIAGSSTLTLDVSTGSAAVTVVSGSHEISAPVSLADATTVTVTPSTSTLTLSNLQSASVAITKAGAGTLALSSARAGALNIDAGTVAILSNGTTTGTSKVGALVLAGGSTPTATLDLADNDLVVAGGSRSTVEAQVKTARNSGAWTGAGITSSAARANAAATTGLGVLTGAEYTSLGGTGTFAGQTYSAADVLVKYTWNGDANFDGAIGFDDYVRIDTGFNTALTGWANGDFNYDGVVNFDDYVLIDVAFNAQNGTLANAIAFLSGDSLDESGRTDFGELSRAATGVQIVSTHFDELGDVYAYAFLAAVPESSLLPVTLLTSTGLCLLARRSRKH